jgi:hypothetical protein
MRFKLYYNKAERKWTLFFSGKSHVVSDVAIHVPVTTVLRANPQPRAFLIGDATYIATKGGRASVR